MTAESSAANAVQTPAPIPAEQAEQTPAPTLATVQASEIKGRSRWRAIIPISILLLAAAIFFAITGNWNSWVGGREIQETDDATLRSDLTPLSTRVSGTVAQVAVNDYQKVKAGDLLVQIK